MHHLHFLLLVVLVGLVVVAFVSLAFTFVEGTLVTAPLVLAGAAPWLCELSPESLGSFSFSVGVSFSVTVVRERAGS